MVKTVLKLTHWHESIKHEWNKELIRRKEEKIVKNGRKDTERGDN